MNISTGIGDQLKGVGYHQAWLKQVRGDRRQWCRLAAQLGGVATLGPDPLARTEAHTESSRLGPRLAGPFTVMKTPGEVVITVTREGHWTVASLSQLVCV